MQEQALVNASSIKATKFWASVLKLGSGAVISQVILLLSFPILARLYPPTEFAKWGTFTAYITIMRAIIHGKYEDAIIAQPSHRQAVMLMWFCIRLGFITTILSTSLYYFLISDNIFGYGVLDVNTVIMVFLFHLLMIIVDPLRQLLLRHSRFTKISNLEIGRGISRTGSQISFGLMGMGYFGMVVGEVISRASMLMLIPKRFWKLLLGQLRGSKSTGHNSLKNLYQFPLFVLPSALIVVLIFNLGTPLVNYYFGPHDAGLYTLIVRSITFPLMLLGNTIADVFYRTLAKEPQLSHPIFVATAKKLFLLGALLCFGGVVFAPLLLDKVLGDKWYGSGVLTQISAPWLMMQIIVTPLSRVLYIANKQVIKLIFDVLSLAILVFGIIGCHSLGFSFIHAIEFISFSMVLLSGIYFLFLFRISKTLSV